MGLYCRDCMDYKERIAELEANQNDVPNKLLEECIKYARFNGWQSGVRGLPVKLEAILKARRERGE